MVGIFWGSIKQFERGQKCCDVLRSSREVFLALYVHGNNSSHCTGYNSGDQPSVSDFFAECESLDLIGNPSSNESLGLPQPGGV